MLVVVGGMEPGGSLITTVSGDPGGRVEVPPLLTDTPQWAEGPERGVVLIGTSIEVQPGVQARRGDAGWDRRQSMRKVAADLGLSQETLRGWVNQDRIDRGEGKAGELTTAEKQELHQAAVGVVTLNLGGLEELRDQLVARSGH